MTFRVQPFIQQFPNSLAIIGFTKEGNFIAKVDLDTRYSVNTITKVAVDNYFIVGFVVSHFSITFLKLCLMI